VLDDDPYAPYNPTRRLGGLLVLLYHFDQDEDNFIPTRPTAIGSDYLQYPYTLPTPTEVPQLRKFVVAIPKLTNVRQSKNPATNFSRTLLEGDLFPKWAFHLRSGHFQPLFLTLFSSMTPGVHPRFQPVTACVFELKKDPLNISLPIMPRQSGP